MSLFSRLFLAAVLLAAPAAWANGLSGAYLAGKHAAVNADVKKAGEYFARALARDPGNPRLMEQALIYLTASGSVDRAIPIARKLYEAQPGHRMSNLVMTVEAFSTGRFGDAAERISGAPGAYHPLVGALLALWAEQGVGENGEEALDQLEDRAIFRIFGGYHKGLTRAARGDLSGADEAFTAAMADLAQPTGRMALAYGAVLRRMGETERAIQLYTDAIGASVGDASLEKALAEAEAGIEAALFIEAPAQGAAEALFGLASALNRDGEERLSLFYTRLAEHLWPGFDDARLLSAEILDRREQYELAIAAYASIPDDSALHRSAEIGRADAFLALEQEERAIEVLTALTRRMPEAIDAQLALGDLMRRTSRFEEGAVAYDAAIKLMAAKGRENWVIFYERGICYERSDRWELAEADFQKALELRPDQPLVLNYLGYSLLDKGFEARYDEALELIRKAVEQRPEDGYIVDSLGWGFYLTGDFENAVVELERAVELRPVDPVINDHLGDALWQVGRMLEAEFQWRRAMSFDPEDKDLARIKRKLKVGLDIVLAEEETAPTEAAASGENDGG